MRATLLVLAAASLSVWAQQRVLLKRIARSQERPQADLTGIFDAACSAPPPEGATGRVVQRSLGTTHNTSREQWYAEPKF